MLFFACRLLSVVVFWSVCVMVSGCSYHAPVEVEEALVKAGDRRGEFERVLEHYRAVDRDEQKLEAAEFLIANMEGHGYTVAGFYDADRNEVPYEALDYANYAEARDAIDVLEEEHGEISVKRKRFDADVEMISAEYLIENVDLAFTAWREKPWAQDIPFDTFCEYILPYRGSNEPINSFRADCMERCADVESKMKDPTDIHEATQLIQSAAGGWIGFNEIYYLHPTDQGYEEMKEKRLGRCEDITNMITYAARANAVITTSDYTPHWANRDNNHAWTVVLDSQGKGKAGLSNVAAKIYRKMFSIQRDSLALLKRDDEKVPKWLGGKNYRDVTDQYLDTTDVRVELVNERPEGTRFAYLCVFNGGDWKAIHWGEIDETNHVMFTKMGRHIAYLPAYYVDEALVPAGPTFILTKEGEIRPCVADPAETIGVEMSVTTPEIPDADMQMTKPMIVVKPGVNYELFYWDDGWESAGKQVSGDEPVSFDGVPCGGLYWLVAEDSRRLERIFTFADGVLSWW